MISDLEMDEDQRVPTDPKHLSGSFSQSVPIDLSMKSRRFHTVSTETNLSLVKELASNQKHISVASSLLFSCFNARRSTNLLGVFSLLDGKSLLPSTSRSYTVKSVQLKALPDHDGSTEDDQKPNDEQSGGYVINPTTGNRCKKNYKNVTVEKRLAFKFVSIFTYAGVLDTSSKTLQNATRLIAHTQQCTPHLLRTTANDTILVISRDVHSSSC
ncbi:unnamed protein product [Anisakis simplex]|uniref:Kinesin motor domain-containing protein n=1 Tax=Anisakis simplex TaxID=6269 RepID=A0A0M3JFB5_ANISI|nr:unnamed protein product [Anisakis simplex]